MSCHEATNMMYCQAVSCQGGQEVNGCAKGKSQHAIGLAFSISWGMDLKDLPSSGLRTLSSACGTTNLVWDQKGVAGVPGCSPLARAVSATADQVA